MLLDQKQVGILMSSPMVESLLARRKFMTRRVIKPQPIIDDDSGYVFHGKHKDLFKNDSLHEDWRIKFAEQFCKYGAVGDQLFVRESWVETCDNLGIPIVAYKGGGNPIYIGSGNELLGECKEPWSLDNYPAQGRWRPSLFMPKSFSRILLENTGVKIERVADITADDAIREGIYSEWDGSHTWYKDYENEDRMFKSDPIKSFRSLWRKINGTPSMIQEKVDGKLKTVGYIVYAFDEQDAEQFKGVDTWRNGLPLKVVINPWCYCVSFDVLSITGGKNKK